MPNSRVHHPRCPQYDGDDVMPGSRCDQNDWDCRCDLIDRVLEDQAADTEAISDASFSRGVARGLADAVTTLADLAVEAELLGRRVSTRALLAAMARLLPAAMPTDPNIAITFDKQALEAATAILRHDLDAGYWDTDQATETAVNAILAAWQKEASHDMPTNTAVMPLSLWDEAASLLSVAHPRPAALDRIEQSLAVFEPAVTR